MAPDTDRGDLVEPARRTEAAVALGRRRLLRGGVSAAPVIMTLASSPVSAGVCTTASAYGSMNPSGRYTSLACGGRSPATWTSTAYGQWPISANALFSSQFSPALSDSTLKFKNVVDPGAGHDAVARHCVAALLNAAVGGLVPVSILDAGKAKMIWSSYATMGYFEPTAGIRWNGPQIVDWIATTYA